MLIKGPDKVVFGVEDMAEARRFALQYGLDEIEGSAVGASFEALDGSGIELRLASDSSLPTAVVGGPTSRLVIWGVEDAASLQAIAAELSKDRKVSEIADGLLASHDNDGHSIAFRVSRRHVFEATPALVNAPGMRCRPVNDFADFKAIGKARAMGHVVFWSKDPEKSMRFYIDRLGFLATDRVADNRGVFARAPAHGDHHSLFFLQTVGRFKPSFQHIEFQFRDVQEVMVGGDRMSEFGWKTHMGPGRHIMGSNWYWYFDSPMGGAFELSADMDQIDDRWVPRVIPRSENGGITPIWNGPPGMGPNRKVELEVSI